MGFGAIFTARHGKPAAVVRQESRVHLKQEQSQMAKLLAEFADRTPEVDVRGIKL